MEYLKLNSLEEAFEALKSNNNSKIIAGGTDLLVQYRHKKIKPDLIVDIKEIDVLSGIKIEDDYLKIGACTKLNDIAENPVIKKDFHAIQQATWEIGCYQIRNRGTIGGNICNASPAGDTIPPLYCMEGIVSYFYDGNMHDIEAKDFFTGPGKTKLPENAILCQVKIPMKYAGKPSVYCRHARRNSLDLSTVSVTIVNNNNKFAIALGSVAPTVIRVPDAESILNSEGLTEDTANRSAIAAANTCKPISDLRGSKEYRVEMVRSYTFKALKALMEEWN